MDKFYIKDNKIYVENEVELIELTLNELIEETNRLAKKECMMELALEMACDDLRNLTKTYYKTTKQLSREYKILAKENKDAQN